MLATTTSATVVAAAAMATSTITTDYQVLNLEPKNHIYAQLHIHKNAKPSSHLVMIF